MKLPSWDYICHTYKFQTNPFTFSSVVHLDVTPIALITLSRRSQYASAACLRSLTMISAKAALILPLRNVRRPSHVYLRLHKPAHEKVTWGEIGLARRPGQIGPSASHPSLRPQSLVQHSAPVLHEHDLVGRS